MKNRFLALALFLSVMAALPLSVVKCGSGSSASETADSAATLSATDEADQKSAAEIGIREKAVAYAASVCEEDFCDEALKAAVILANTDCEFIDIGDFDSSEELYMRVSGIYFSGSELYLGNEKKFIPSSPVSNGATSTDEAYPYLKSAASPWERFDEGYDPESSCAGVSMRGVNYLCGRGFSAEEALLHYLPGFEIRS